MPGMDVSSSIGCDTWVTIPVVDVSTSFRCHTWVDLLQRWTLPPHGELGVGGSGIEVEVVTGDKHRGVGK
jgi:hypothetical protein